MTIEQWVIIGSLISFLVVGFWVRKSDTNSFVSFSMLKGRLGWFPISAGISMTFAGGAAVLNTASLAYSYKWFSLIDPGAVLIGILIAIFFYKKYLLDQGITISDLLASNYKPLAILIGSVTSFVFLLILAAQFVALSKLLSPFFPEVNPLLLTFILSTLIFSYVFWGGFNSVTRTDVLQLVLIISCFTLPLVIFLSISSVENQVVYSHEFTNMPLEYIILFSIPIVFIPLSQDINVRIKSAKSERDGKLGMVAGAFFYFAIVFSSALVGIFLGKNDVPLEDPEQALAIFFKDHLASIGYVSIIATLAAIVSSLDAYALNSITSISKDILTPVTGKMKNVKQLINLSALITFVISISIALFFNQILALVLTALLTYISVLLPVAFGRYLKVESRDIFLCGVLILGSICTIEIFQLSSWPSAILYPSLGILLMAGFYLKTKIWGRG